MDVETDNVVFVPHYNVEFNYNNAKRYGSLEFGFTFDFEGDEVFDATVKKKLRTFMSSFDAETDYILVSGSPSMCMYALAVAVDRNEHPVTCLRFDRETKQYKEVLFDV